MTLIRAFDESLARHPNVGRVWLVAVSGGPDSMALLRTAQIAASRTGAEVLSGHIDHQLRPDSGADAEWVADQCQKLGIRCLTQTVTVPHDGAIEETARRVRYEALAQMAAQAHASAILTGHTADDQAETVLHHLFRGTGLQGLVGIPEVRQLHETLWIWRPLLSVRRQLIVDELQHWQQPFRTDSSNASSRYTRNRVRNELIPWLERELNPRSVDAVLRLSEQAAETLDWLQSMAAKLLNTAIVQPETEVVRLRCAPLVESAPVVARECFVQLWRRKDWPRQAMTRTHWEKLVELCSADGPPALQMPGEIDVRRRGDLLVLTPPSPVSS